MNDNNPVSDSPEPFDNTQGNPVQPQDRSASVALPQSAPYVTYTIIGVTVAFYLLQIASVALFGYPTTFSNIGWLELYGARINEFILERDIIESTFSFSQKFF